MPERKLIERIRRGVKGGTAGVRRGIGDDCAVLGLPRGHEALVTTDLCLEGVHFRRDLYTAEEIGYRCLTRGLSDIAAMGGEPLAVFLSLALPKDVKQTWVDGFFRGLNRLASKFQVTLAGGDIAQSPSGVLADIIVVGSVSRGKAVLRSGARPGDDIYVTGRLGGATADLHKLLSGTKPSARRRPKPVPRIEVGRFLRQHRLASSMIDLSDGLSTDLSHICEESGVGAWVASRAIPVASGATFDDALNGGEDYELLFTVPPRKNSRLSDVIAGVPITFIGTITRRPGMWLVSDDMKSRTRLKPAGWEHLRNL